MISINYIILLLLIIFINSFLLNKKIENISNIEKFDYLHKNKATQFMTPKELSHSELHKYTDGAIKRAEYLKKKKMDNNAAFSYILKYFTGQKKKNNSLMGNIKKNNPLNNFTITNGMKCKNIQIDLKNKISSNSGSEDLIKRMCANECHKSKKCLSFDYKNKSCRLSTWCTKDTSKNDNTYSIYQDKTKPVPTITKFNIYPKKKMSGICTTSKIKGRESNSSLIKCANKCSKNKECLSFDLTGNKKDICRIYKKCHKSNTIHNNNSFSGVLVNSLTYSIKSRKNKKIRKRPN
tara:strand:- start:132 stop:1010 length:879 start_codon:yes stop_codon:yes gene_type:complete